MRITKSEISMRTWRSPMSAASQGAFVVIPEISHSDISYIIKKSKWRFCVFFTKSSQNGVRVFLFCCDKVCSIMILDYGGKQI